MNAKLDKAESYNLLRYFIWYVHIYSKSTAVLKLILCLFMVHAKYTASLLHTLFEHVIELI